MAMLTPAVRDFLHEIHFAVAATISADGLPHQTVVWYLLDDADETLVISIPHDSLKHRHLLRDGRMSVCIEDGFRYVTMSGPVVLTDDPDREVYRRMRARYQPLMAQGVVPPPPPPGSRNADLMSRPRIIIRLKPEHIHTNGLD